MYKFFAVERKDGVVFGMRKRFDKRSLLLLFLFALLLGNLLVGMAGDAAAGTTNGNLPWEGALGQISASLEGPVAKSLCLIMVIVSVGTLIFGGDLSGWARSVAFMALAAGIIGGAATFITALGVTGALIL